MQGGDGGVSGGYDPEVADLRLLAPGESHLCFQAGLPDSGTQAVRAIQSPRQRAGGRIRSNPDEDRQYLDTGAEPNGLLSLRLGDDGQDGEHELSVWLQRQGKRSNRTVEQSDPLRLRLPDL